MSKREKPYGGKLSALDTLFGDAPESAAELIPVAALSPRSSQPRRYFGNLDALTASVRAHGVLQPVLVRPNPKGGFELITGERRLRAAQAAGLSQIPAVVKDLSDTEAAEVAVLENLQREDLNPIEETDAVLSLVALRLAKPVPEAIFTLKSLYDEGRGRTGNNVVSNREKELVTDLFASLGRFSPASFYTHRVPLLKLPETLLETVRRGKLEYSKARLLARIKDDVKRQDLLDKTLAEALTLSDLKMLLREPAAPKDTTVQDPVKRLSVLGRTLKQHGPIENEKKRTELEKVLARLEALLTTL